MSQFQTVQLFDDSCENNDLEVTTNKPNNEKLSMPPDKKEVVIQIRDQETTSTNYINYIIEINVLDLFHSND